VRTEDGYIIHKCLNGDSMAFGFLVDKYKAGVYAFAYERLHNFHDAEDIAQEVFLKAYKSLRTLRRWDSFASWLYRITLNLCRNWIRAQSSRPDHEFIEDQDPELLENHSKDLYRQELACESVREALNSLPEIYCQALTLHYFGGMTSMEIARFAGVSPSAIRMRLSKARSLLKEESLAMMSTAFEKQKLQSNFTFRIVDAVKKMKIQPTPRTGGLPWGLSLATGIIFAVLSFIPQPGILNRVAAGSPLPGEAKVLKTGEIPVDILAVSEISIIANRQGDGDGGEPGSSAPRNANLAVANDDEGVWAQASKEAIVDPETGVKYTRIKTLTGKNDVIRYNAGLNLSPNGKFLLWGQLVIPVDDGEPFELVDMVTDRSVWSPDGKKVAFYADGAIWVLPVSPETGQATGTAGKLLDGEYWYQHIPSWSPDSERIVFERRDEETIGHIWTLSVRDGTLTQITDEPGKEHFPIWSPDGRTIAYQKGYYEVWLVSAESGTPRKIGEHSRYGTPQAWSPDSKWLCYGYGAKRFFRLADGCEFEIDRPNEVGDLLSWSPNGGNMLFYRPSYDYKSSLKVVSVSGGPSLGLGSQLTLWPYGGQFWSPDSKMIVTGGEDKDGEGGFLIIPLAGGDPLPLKLDISVSGGPTPRSLSPDRKRLLFSVKRGENTEDLWVVPISLKDARTTGPAAMVFSGRDKYPEGAWAWSPDGTKLAVIHKWRIWIASAEGGEPVQITPGSQGGDNRPVWSPDGNTISYDHFVGSSGKALLHVIPASGGEARKILDVPGDNRHTWSSNGKELTVAVASEGVISAIPISGGEPRQISNLKELNIDYTRHLRWSPDGRNIAFIGFNKGQNKDQIFIVPAEGGKATELAADDPGEKYCLFWSPDGKWISYNSDGNVKTRPGGEIWEADVSEFLSGGESEQ